MGAIGGAIIKNCIKNSKKRAIFYKNCPFFLVEATGFETQASPTHWCVLRKTAQRILFNNANSSAIRNCYEDLQKTVRLSVQSGRSNFYAGP